MIKRLIHWAISLPLLLASVNHPLHAGNDQPEDWADESQILTVTSPYLDMHTFAGRGYPIFHVVEKGEKVRVIKNRTDWFKVETIDGRMGWVMRQHMSGTVDQHQAAVDFSNRGWKDPEKNDFEAGIVAGLFAGAISYTPFIVYRFTPNVHGELKYTQAFGEFSTLKITSIGLTHQPFPSWRLSPFFRLSSGVIQTNPSTILVSAEDRKDPIVSVGGGLALHVSNRLILRVEYDNHTILTTRNLNEEVEEWKAGFGVLF